VSTSTLAPFVVVRAAEPAAAYTSTPCANDVLGPAFWVVGHRGSPIAEVENTLESVQRAVHEGANAVEVDLSVTRDREVVLWHDYDPNDLRARFRQWGLEPYVGYRPVAPWFGALRRPTSELSLRALRRDYGYAHRHRLGPRVDREIPRLGQFFEWAAHEPRLELVFLDMKVPKERIDLLPTILARVDALEARYGTRVHVVLESAEAEVVGEVRRRAPKRDVVLDVEPHAGLVFDLHSPSAARAAIRHRLRRAVAQKPRSITLFPFATHRKIIERDMDLLRRFNDEHPERAIEGLCSFLINEPEEMARLLTLGVTAIQTDRPALLRELAEAHGHHFESAGERTLV
jgi:glycerophosphoryl diester phosphodiesterase